MLRITKYLALILFTGAIFGSAPAAHAQISVGIGVAVHIGPPALPVYEQPICPGDGYLWTPGYWAYGADGYFWVPGTWVMAPQVGFLWTPGYWGWGGGGYLFHAGYWGPHVGFYGGINYGFGYGGVGFVGGEWRGGVFAYNTAVMHVNTAIIHNTYVNRTVIHNTTMNRVSYNGGNGGINARPTAEEQRFAHEQHLPARSMQVQHEQAARNDHTMLASVNHGRPAVAATARPGEFHGNGAVAARAAGPGGNRAVPRPPASEGNRPGSAANDRAAQNHSVPRPPANNARQGNERQNNERMTSNRASNNRVADDRASNSRVSNDRESNPRSAPNNIHSSAPKLAPVSHPAPHEHAEGHSGERK